MAKENQQHELSRSMSMSMPVLNKEDGVIKKIQEQDGIISLLQTQVELQTETISKHSKLFDGLLSKMQDLTEKVKTLEDILNKEKESADRDAKKSALWASTSGEGGKTDNANISIADMVKETAEQTLGTDSQYVYDESLGLYYDQSSGYYYDPVKQLFYNGHTKTYYSYDAATNTYQVQPVESTKRKKSKKIKSKKAVKQQKIVMEEIESNPQIADDTDSKLNVTFDDGSTINEAASTSSRKDTGKVSPKIHDKPGSDMEDGELTSSSSPTSAESSPSASSTTHDSSGNSDNEEAQVTYPPCIRAVVQSDSRTSTFKNGTLFIIPYTGGTVGSKGKQHIVLLPTPTVEKMHAKIFFHATEANTESESEYGGKYYVVDMGSKEGTFLNRTRISEAGCESEPCELAHGSTLQIGDVTLLIHIHPGDFTCGHCEPGLIIQKDPMYEYTGDSTTTRKAEMKKIKKKYGLDRKNEGIRMPSETKTEYIDRAKNRRQVLGSENPYAKTEVASTEMPIKQTNVGFKMLQKMGWKGEALGKDSPENHGITEPIKCEGRNDKRGLGLSTDFVVPSSMPSDLRKSKKLSKTIERFKECSSNEDPSNQTDNFDY